MSITTQQIKEALKKFSALHGPEIILQATVTAINNNDTISAKLSNDIVIGEVRLKSVVKEGGKVLLIPAIDSTVIIASIENSEEFVVVAVEEVSQVYYLVGTTKYRVDENGFLIQRGSEDLLSIMNDFIDEVIGAIFITPSGNTTGMLPTSSNALSSIKTRLNNLLKSS
jgi:hypothetical protein